MECCSKLASTSVAVAGEQRGTGYSRWAVGIWVIWGALAVAGCSRSTNLPPGADPTGNGSRGGAAHISASPNPVPITGGKGTTTIDWDTGDGSRGEVYMSRAGKAEQLFAGISAHGSQKVNWISAGGKYEFRLYAGKEHKRILASVEVTGQ